MLVHAYVTSHGKANWSGQHQPRWEENEFKIHSVTCYTNSIVSRIHVNTTKLRNIMCTLVATCVVLQSLNCVRDSVHLYSDHEVLGLRTIPLLKSTVLHHGDGNSLGIGFFFYNKSPLQNEQCWVRVLFILQGWNNSWFGTLDNARDFVAEYIQNFNQQCMLVGASRGAQHWVGQVSVGLLALGTFGVVEGKFYRTRPIPHPLERLERG